MIEKLTLEENIDHIISRHEGEEECSFHVEDRDSLIELVNTGKVQVVYSEAMETMRKEAISSILEKIKEIYTNQDKATMQDYFSCQGIKLIEDLIRSKYLPKGEE